MDMVVRFSFGKTEIFREIINIYLDNGILIIRTKEGDREINFSVVEFFDVI